LDGNDLAGERAGDDAGTGGDDGLRSRGGGATTGAETGALATEAGAGATGAVESRVSTRTS
jgi:hypothetical protein